MMWTQNSILLREADAVYIRFRSDKINEDGWFHKGLSRLEDRGVPEGMWEHEFVPPFGQSGSRLDPIRGSALGVLSA